MSAIPHPDHTLLFFGRVVAGYSHEIRNILAIINESSGLMHDILALKKRDLGEDTQRFVHSLQGIGQQVQRGQELTSFLNAFAHSPDREKSEVDVVHCVRTVCALCARLLRNRNLHLLIQPEQERVFITTRPVECMLWVFCALEWAMLHAQPGAEILFQVQKTQQEVRITVSGMDQPEGTKHELYARLQEVASLLQGECTLAQGQLMLTLA